MFVIEEKVMKERWNVEFPLNFDLAFARKWRFHRTTAEIFAISRQFYRAGTSRVMRFKKGREGRGSYLGGGW